MQRGQHLIHRHAKDAAVVAVCWLVIVLSGAQTWATLNSPDSEFYASLAVFGSEVTDRAIYPVYYWTRLGFIAPVHGLTQLFGADSAFVVFRLILILVAIIALYSIVRRWTSPFISGLIVLALSLNTVLLSFLGNPYVTGSAMVALLVISAAAMSSHLVVGPAVAGASIGWLVMLNPYAALLGAVSWLTIWLLRNHQTRAKPIQARSYLNSVAVGLGSAAVAGALAMGTYLAAGMVLFPDLAWLDTYLFWNSVLQQSDYIGESAAWPRDAAMVIPFIACAVAVGVAALAKTHRQPHILAAAAIGAPLAFGLIYQRLVGGNTLDWPQYQAFLWPGVLVAIGLIVAGLVGFTPVRPSGFVLAIAAIIAIWIAGHWVGEVRIESAWIVAVLITLGALLVLAISLRFSPSSVLIAIIVMGIMLSTFQILQNGRRWQFGVNPHEWYSNAFQENDVAATISASLEAERWLIANTTRTDKVMLWVEGKVSGGEESLLPMAAFQLFGANTVTIGGIVQGSELERLRALDPDVLALYATSTESAVDFWAGLPMDLRYAPPDCTTFPWPDSQIQTAYVCIVRR